MIPEDVFFIKLSNLKYLCFTRCPNNCSDTKPLFAQILLWILPGLKDIFSVCFCLTLILLTCRIWWAPNNASKWQMGFNLAFKGFMCLFILSSPTIMNSKKHFYWALTKPAPVWGTYCLWPLSIILIVSVPTFQPFPADTRETVATFL
jgi:hypothetical protein